MAAVGTGIAAGGLLATQSSPANATPLPINYPLGATPGSPKPWHGSTPIYGGMLNLSSGNAQIAVPIAGWGGKGGGLSFSLTYNSQSSRTSALGSKWTHSYRMQIIGTNPAIVVLDDGTEHSFSLVGGSYVAPAGVFDSLVLNGNGSWTLTRKGGMTCQFSSAGLLTSLADLNGNTVSLTYSSGLLTTITDAASRTLSLGYASGALTSVTDCKSRVWSLAYTSGMLTSVSDPLLSGQSYSRQFSYDNSSNLVTYTNRLGKVWNYGYATTGNALLSVSDPDHSSVSSGATAAWSLPIDGSWPSNANSALNWKDGNGNNHVIGFDNLGRQVLSQDGSGNITLFSFDTSHNRLSTQLPSGATWQSTFDTRGNQLTSTDPNNHSSVSTFDSGDRLLTSTDALNHETVNVYSADGKGNLVQTTDPNNNVSQMAYNSDGSMSQLRDGENRVSNFGYDGWGHQSSVTVVKDVNTSFVTSFVFDKGSHLTQRTDGLNRITNFTLDDWGRTTGISYPTSGNSSVSLSMDAEGGLTQTVDGTGTRTYQYDSWQRRTSMTDPRGNTSATYDNVGNLKTQLDITSRQISYSYGITNLLTQVGDSAGNGNYTYSVDGRVLKITYPNGTQVDYTYDTAGRVSNLKHSMTSGGTVIINYAAVYDNADRLTQITETPSNDVTSLVYDNGGRLTSESRTGTKPYSGVYTYDHSGLRSTALIITNGTTVHNGAYSYDGAGRLSQVVDSATSVTENYTWNADGTLASSPGPSYTRNFVYDEEGRLLSIAHGSTVAFQYGYAYDGGRRWRKDIASSLWTWYPCGVACSAGELVEQTSDLTGNTWATSAIYLKGGSGCSTQTLRRNNDTELSSLNNTVSIVTDQTGTVVSTLINDVFGNRQYQSGSSSTLSTCAVDAEFSLLQARNVQQPLGSNKCKCGCGGSCKCGGGLPPINGVCLYFCTGGTPHMVRINRFGFRTTVQRGCDYAKCILQNPNWQYACPATLNLWDPFDLAQQAGLGSCANMVIPYWPNPPLF